MPAGPVSFTEVEIPSSSKFPWSLLAAELTAVDRLKGAGSRSVDGVRNLREVVLDDAPFNGRQRHDRQTSPRQVLLVRKRPVSGDEYLEAVSFGGFQELSILETAPTPKARSNDVVRPKVLS